MRSIGIREFRQNLSQEIKDLPLEITLRGEPVAYVYTTKQSNLGVPTDKVHKENKKDIISAVKESAIRKNIKLCKHGYAIGLCKKGC